MEQAVLRAGAGKAEITPSEKLLPMPLIYVLNFNRILDSVYVRALALSNGEQQSLFVTFDMTCVPYPEETMEFLVQKTGLPRENIFLAATHTHGVTPISIFEEYKNKKAQKKCRDWYEQIKVALLSAIHKAQGNMIPARYGYGEGTSYINVNRDLDLGKKSVLGQNYDRPSDKTIRMLRIESMEGKTIALIVNYACHAVVLNGCMIGLSSGISGDFPGRTSTKLETQIDGAVAFWCSGASGDQNPRLMCQQYIGRDAKGKPVFKNLGKATLAVLDYLSDEHARDISRANENISCTKTDARLYGAEKREPVLTKDGETPYVLRLWMIGDIAFQGISCEIVTSIGKAVRDTSPYEHTILVSHTSGYQSYVADDWEYEHRAFEVQNSKVLKGEAQKAFVRGFTDLFSKTKG